MNREEFYKNFDSAIISLFDLSKKYCLNQFPDKTLFDIVFDNPNKINYLTPENQLIFRHISSKKIKNISSETVKELLWQNGHVPLYSDVSISHITSSISYIQLFTSKRFSNNDENIMHKIEGCPPFHVQVRLPANYVENIKFDINYWHNFKQPSLKKFIKKYIST